MTPPRVSVVIPVYNPGPYIQACIDGLLAQTLPADGWEAIFVDDGSTDDTPQLLDALAAEHPAIRVFHEPHSGWPGRPRNVGIEHASGEFVFFCDHDDWLGAEALERLYRFAVETDADVVIGKMAGINRKVPVDLFERTVRRASLADTPLMESSTPHKLFRRSLLESHGIRFPEGRRRLEDHLFVITAYLRARNVAIYADYTCYYHVRRPDRGNAAYQQVDWESYYANLRESLDVVVANVPQGVHRDGILRRWLQIEVVHRLSGRWFLGRPQDERHALFAAARRTATDYFGPGVVALLGVRGQAIARRLLDGDRQAVLQLAVRDGAWQLRVQLDAVEWSDGALAVRGTARLADWSSGEPDCSNEALGRLTGGASDATVDEAIGEAQLRVHALRRHAGERWSVPVVSAVGRLTWDFTARLDPDELAAGEPLAPGRWDLYADVAALGLRRTCRLTAGDGSRVDPVVLDRDRPTATHPIAAYFTRGNLGLTVSLGSEFPPRRPKAPAQPGAARGAGVRERRVGAVRRFARRILRLGRSAGWLRRRRRRRGAGR